MERIDVYESDVESKIVSFVKKVYNGIAYKFVSPMRNGVPDRLCLLPIPVKHRGIVARYVKFIEVKKPGEKPSHIQVSEHKLLKELGYKVIIIDNKKDAQSRGTYEI